jgi:hypothetical protein
MSAGPARAILIGLLVITASSFPSFADDLWIEAHEDSSSGGAVQLRAVMGAKFPTGEETKKAGDYKDARLQREGKIEPLPGFGKEPTLLGSLSAKEPFFVSVIGPTREIDLKPVEVREYLSELVGAGAARIDSLLKDSGGKLHETYSRTLKAFVIPRGATFPPLALGFDHPFSHPLEILLTAWNPGHDPKKESTQHTGPCTSLEFQLRRDGKPLGGAFVRIVTSDGKTQTVRTNEEGKAATREVIEHGPVLIVFIELSASQKGRYQTRWANLAIHDLR